MDILFTLELLFLEGFAQVDIAAMPDFFPLLSILIHVSPVLRVSLLSQEANAAVVLHGSLPFQADNVHAVLRAKILFQLACAPPVLRVILLR